MNEIKTGTNNGACSSVTLKLLRFISIWYFLFLIIVLVGIFTVFRFVPKSAIESFNQNHFYLTCVLVTSIVAFVLYKCTKEKYFGGNKNASLEITQYGSLEIFSICISVCYISSFLFEVSVMTIGGSTLGGVILFSGFFISPVISLKLIAHKHNKIIVVVQTIFIYFFIVVINSFLLRFVDVMYRAIGSRL